MSMDWHVLNPNLRWWCGLGYIAIIHNTLLSIKPGERLHFLHHHLHDFSIVTLVEVISSLHVHLIFSLRQSGRRLFTTTFGKSRFNFSQKYFFPTKKRGQDFFRANIFPFKKKGRGIFPKTHSRYPFNFDRSKRSKNSPWTLLLCQGTEFMGYPAGGSIDRSTP